MSRPHWRCSPLQLLLDCLSRKPLADQTVRDAAVVGLLGVIPCAVPAGRGGIGAGTSGCCHFPLGLAPDGSRSRRCGTRIRVLDVQPGGRRSPRHELDGSQSPYFYWPPNWWFLQRSLERVVGTGRGDRRGCRGGGRRCYVCGCARTRTCAANCTGSCAAAPLLQLAAQASLQWMGALPVGTSITSSWRWKSAASLLCRGS